MSRSARALLGAAAILASVLGPGAPAWGAGLRKLDSHPRWERHPTRILVKLREGAPEAALEAPALAARARPGKALGAARLRVMELAEIGVSMEEALAELNASPLVEYAEPDYIVHALDAPDDPEFPSQWGLQQPSDADIDAPEAWEVTEGDPGLVVAVVDTGVDYEHADLAANLWRNPGETLNGLDDDGNGYVDDLHGIDCIGGTGDPMDDDGHGTHVAGTIGAVGHNGIAGIGVSPRVQIMALRFLGPTGGAISDAIECLNYALEMKRSRGVDVRVANNSWGGGGFSQALLETIEDLADEDILFVAAAGNDGTDNDLEPEYPASYDVPNVVSVAATDPDDRLAPFSNFGAETVHLAAPGVGILSTIPGDLTEVFSGTSMATAFVSGAAALVLAHDPGADALAAKAALLANADPVGGVGAKVASRGRLNAAQALCSPGDIALGMEPGPGFRAGRWVDTPLRVWLRDCGTPLTGAAVRVRFSDGEPELALSDDGIAPDAIADDGVYAATWRPTQLGEVRLDAEATVSGVTSIRSVTGTVVDVTRYTVTDEVPFDWIDATRGKEIRGWEDDSDARLSIGFPFFFHGAVHDKLRISSNGYLTFGTHADEYTNTVLPSRDAPEFLIAPLWDDLHPGLFGRVFYLREGQAPNRRLTIQWHQFGYYRATGKTTFQVTLHELDGRVVFRYLEVESGEPDRALGASATVGIQDGTGLFATQYSSGEPALANGLALEFRVDLSQVGLDVIPVSGRKLRLQEKAGRPDRRRLSVASKDDRIAAPVIGGPSDPSRWGGALRIWNPATGEEGVVDLPAAGWKASKGGARFKGGGACQRVKLKNGNLSASCRGAELGFSLDEPQQGALALRLELGSGTAFCTLFGGAVKADYGVGFGRGGKKGTFTSRDAPAPASCPLP
jgi:hypothetical protein